MAFFQGYAKFNVLGWSDGGISGMIMAGKYQDVVNRLVIWGSNASVTEKDVVLYEAIHDMSKWSPKMREPLEGIKTLTSSQFPVKVLCLCNKFSNINHTK